MSLSDQNRHADLVTDAPSVSSCADAWTAAAAAAADGTLDVRTVDDPSEHRHLEALLGRIWQTGGKPSPISGDLMRMLSYTGSYVAGAYDRDRLVGAAVGVLTGSSTGDPHLHSHIAGVAPDHRGRNIGFALKLHQRAWALDQGFDRITWTFDPLVRRNAYFNLTKLAARATHYLTDFYGDMSDGINAGQGSDRLLVEWALESTEVAAAAHGRPVVLGAVGQQSNPVRELILINADGEPQLGEERLAASRSCVLPADIEAIRLSSPELGRRWRIAVRSALSTALADGARIDGFHPQLGYLIQGSPVSSQ